MPPQQPNLHLIRFEELSDVIESKWEADGVPSFPVAPATLWKGDKPIFEVHQLVARTGNVLTFETYDRAAEGLLAGQSYSYVGWWLPPAFDAISDLTCDWTYVVYPDDGSDEHCLFTWDRIAAYAEHKEGYASDYGWITVPAYNEFILSDRLRLRTARKTVERGG